MCLLSDAVMFPAMQALLLGACVLTFLVDRGQRLSGWVAKTFRRGYRQSAAEAGAGSFAGAGSLSVDVTVQRGDGSMGQLAATAGFSLVVITLINGTAFNNENMWFKDFSVAVNVVDTLIVLYMCFWCAWSRNKILSLFLAVRNER
jgi:hypothetical protein